MHSKRYYSFEPRGSQIREYGDYRSETDPERTTFTTNMSFEPKEGKIDRENYLTKEDSRCVSENVTRSVISRSIIDKRSSSSYKTREDSKSIKTRDLKGITGTNTFPSNFASSTNKDVKEAPISSFYSSYSKDEDLNDAKKSEKPSDNVDVISSFYRSGSERKIPDQKTRADEENRHFAKASREIATSAGLNESKGESRMFAGEADSLARRGSLERHGRIGRTIDDPQTASQEDTNILRRALERKQASNSSERERLTRRFSEDDSSGHLNYTSSAYLSLSDKWRDKDSKSSRFSEGAAHDRDYQQANRIENDRNDDDYSRAVGAMQLSPGKIRTRSRSSEALDEKERSRLGIYKELPGRREYLSYTARRRADEEKELSTEKRRTGSLDRNTTRFDYTGQGERDIRDSLHRLRSRSFGELRSLDEDDEKNIYSSYSSRNLRNQGRAGSERSLVHDVGSRASYLQTRSVGSYSPRKELSTHEKLKGDIARLKEETETRTMKEKITSPCSGRREPSIQDKLKEDIAKLKAETLTREHVKPYTSPSSSRVESKDDFSSRWKSRKPSIQDKLKEDIAKLKAETRDFPSLSRKASDYTTHRIRPDSEVDKNRDVRQSGVTTSSFERYAYSKRDGKVFQDEMQSKETQRYGDPKEGKYDYTTHEDGGLRMVEGTFSQDERRNAYQDPSLSSLTDKDQPRFYSRKPDDSWPRTDERRIAERDDSLISPRNTWDEPTRSSRESRSGSTQGYATKRVFRADSTMSMTSTKNGDRGPSSVRGFFHGSVSEEDQSVYYSKGMGDKDVRYSSEQFKRPEASRQPEPFRSSEYFKQPESARQPEAVRRPELDQPPEPTSPTQPARQPEPHRSPEPSTPTEPSRQPEPARPKESRRPDDAIPLPYPGLESVTRNRKDLILSSQESEDELRKTDREERRVHSNKVQRSSEFVTRKITREDSVISRRSSKDDIDRLASKVEASRRLSERSELSPRRASIRDKMLTAEENKVISPKEDVEAIPENKESKPSAMSELRRKIELLKSKVDALDDSRSRSRLESYVDEHSEKKPDVEIKDPVHIPRYQPTARGMPERGSLVGDVEPWPTRVRTGSTTETINRQISRQTSIDSTIRRISSIREEDLTATSRTPAIDESPGEVFPKVGSEPEAERPAVLVQLRDAETMTAPEIQEQVGADRFQRLDSTITEFTEEPDKIEELRGVPIQHRGTVPRIQEVVDKGVETDSGVTTIQIDTQQQPLSPKKEEQRWWNAFTAEDVDRLLEIGNWGRPNAYTAEDMDKLWQLGPVRRRSFRRGSYERRSFRRHPRRAKDDAVDVHVKVRGKQETRSRPQCIIAQAAPEEKAIVLRDSKESAAPFIRKIKVDDVYGADAVRVENGVVKIKVGDLTTRGRKAWARILQQKDRIVESDGTVTIPVSRDHYQDGVYYTNYYEGQEQDGTARIPIKLKIKEDDKLKNKKLRVAREIRRSGSMRRKRRGAASRAYIVGVRYYHGNMLMSADHYGSGAQQQRMYWRTRRDSSRVGGNEIVLRRNQPYSVPMYTVQRIHEGHKTTRQATSYVNDGGKTVITVHAVPPRPERFNLQQVGENMAKSSGMLPSDSYYNSGSNRQGVSTTSRSYFANSSTSGEGTYRGYTTHSTSGRKGTPYIVTDPSDSLRRRTSGTNGVTRVYTSSQMSSTPTIVPYEDDSQTGGRLGQYNNSFIADPSSFYDAPGSRISVSDARVNAHTAYGEKFDLRDYGDVSKVRYVNGALGNNRIVNDRRWGRGRYRYGSSWNSKQQERLNGRTVSWAVEEVTPDF